MELMTWNLNALDETAEMLIEYLVAASAMSTPFIVAVQECMDLHGDISSEVGKRGGHVHGTGNGTMSVFCSSPLLQWGTPRDSSSLRLVLTEATIGGTTVAIANYHGVAHGGAGSLELAERGGIASEIRWHLDTHAAGRPIVVLGDFNASPTDEEIEGQHCLSAVTEPPPVSLWSHGRSRAQLRPFVPKPGLVGGTIGWSSTTRGKVWRTFDYFLAGPSLLIRDVKANELLRGKPMLVAGWPGPSDHLPVTGTLVLP